MSSGVRRVSRQDIQLISDSALEDINSRLYLLTVEAFPIALTFKVQNLIERCLQLYMNQKEVVETLLAQAKIEPGFTELVWQKLEEENREFFKAYYLRLMVKHQIIEFNKLLEQQVQLMRQMHSTGMATMSTSNGSHIRAMQQNEACYPPDSTAPALKQENMHHTVVPSLSNVFSNGSTTLQSGMHAATEMPSHTGRIDTTRTLLSTQSSNVGMTQGMIGGMIKTEPGYSGSSPYMFAADGNILEPRQTIADASVASYGSVESSSQSLTESLLDADISSFGFLGQIPRNFSLSDLSAEFSQSSDILVSYPRSPFLAADNDSFLDPHDRDHQDSKGLETISEGLSYEGFRSD